MAFVASNPSWVDDAHVGPVAAIETDDSPLGTRIEAEQALLEHLDHA